MSFYERILKPLAFRLSPERAHGLGVALIAGGWVRAKVVADDRLRRTVFGVEFPNPLGLAAGFDKNAEAIHRWAGLGFGFAELGTVTLWPQPGNLRPRLFRFPNEQALVNRMGFNNDGAPVMAGRLRRRLSNIPIGINLGKSRVTPLDRAAQEYARTFGILREYGAYFVINVSSPNTKGLRELQEKSALSEICQAVGTSRPLLVKIAPDLTMGELDDVLEVAHTCGLDGLIATNTTLERPSMPPTPPGGLSGAPLRDLSNEVLSYLANGSDLPIIAAGGVFTGADLMQKLRLGATLAQAYTGFVYRGPAFAPLVLAEYLSELDRDS